MECQKRIIISIVIDDNVIDVEIASNTKISDIKNNLKKIIELYNKKENKNISIDCEHAKFIFNDEVLAEDLELFKYGIWDGSLIKVEV